MLWQGVCLPRLGSGLNTYWHKTVNTKRSKWRCSHHTSADLTPIPFVPVASPGLKPKERVRSTDSPALTYRTGLVWAAKPITATTPWLGTSSCYLPMKHRVPWWCRLNRPIVNAAASTSKVNLLKCSSRPCKELTLWTTQLTFSLKNLSHFFELLN